MMDGRVEEFTTGVMAMTYIMLTSIIVLSWLSVVYAETFKMGIVYLVLMLISFVTFLFKVTGLEIPIEFTGFKDEPGEDMALGFFIGIMLSMPVMADLIEPRVGSVSAPMAMGLIIAVPVVEELFFRGIILTTVGEMTNEMVGLLTQAVLFSLYHVSVWGTDINSVIIGVMIGLLMGCLVVWRESVESAIIAHMMFNAITILWGTLGGVA
ncbi:MAG: hypothetical protein DRO39_05000 [Thermoprotei archaeon]|nr:MAG: hypothetical protein DRO39_05000 [Thermoprotei archaeon]